MLEFGHLCSLADVVPSPGTEDLLIDGTDVTKTIFEPTKKMSSYLVAFIVSDFASVSKRKDKHAMVFFFFF